MQSYNGVRDLWAAGHLGAGRFDRVMVEEGLMKKSYSN